MKQKVDMFAQALLGLVFFVFGLNGFIEFLPPPELTDDRALALMGGFAESGYFFPVLKAVETTAGLLLLVRYFSPLALLLLAPVVVQILLFHLVLEPAGLPVALVVGALEAYLGFFVYKDSFSSVLVAKPLHSR